MKSSRRIAANVAYLLLCVPLIFHTVPAQGQTSKQAEKEKLIAAAREIMTNARYCALITLDSSGRTQARTVDPFPPDENMAVWLATNPRTRKVREIRRRHRVTLYYFDRESQAYVTIHGRARVVNDAKEKAKRWKDEWKNFYPDRAKDYLLIVVTPEKLEVVNVTKGILGDPQTWKPQSVSFPRSKIRVDK
jgi:general stress protein 26